MGLGDVTSAVAGWIQTFMGLLLWHCPDTHPSLPVVGQDNRARGFSFRAVASARL